MVNVGKREDALIDWAQAKSKRVEAALDQISLYEGTPLTANEYLILNTLRVILEEKESVE